MREQIYELIDSYAGMWNADKSALATKLEALICYREVNGILQYIGLDGLCPEHEDDLVMQLMPDYPTKMIWNAIDQYKNEHQ